MKAKTALLALALLTTTVAILPVASACDNLVSYGAYGACSFQRSASVDGYGASTTGGTPLCVLTKCYPTPSVHRQTYSIAEFCVQAYAPNLYMTAVCVPWIPELA